MSGKPPLHSDTLKETTGTNSSISKCAPENLHTPRPTKKPLKNLRVTSAAIGRRAKTRRREDGDGHFDQRLRRQSKLSLNLEKQSTISLANPGGIECTFTPEAFDLRRTRTADSRRAARSHAHA